MKKTYNDRIFSSGIRKKIHLARFRWLQKEINTLSVKHKSVIELGCYDGKTINYLPTFPDTYLGLDANWEKGLDIAAELWEKYPQFIFRECHRPDDMDIAGREFDIAICMETFEHVPPEQVKPYLKELSDVTKDYIFITVPNEKGIVFFFKHIAKLFMGTSEKYTFSEFIYASINKLTKVERDQHKGFDYSQFIEDVALYFDIYQVVGLPLQALPLSLNFTIAIVGKKRKK